VGWPYPRCCQDRWGCNALLPWCRPVGHLPALRLSVSGPIIGINKALETALIIATVAASSAARTCWYPPPAGSRQQVKINLHRAPAQQPWPCRLSLRLPDGSWRFAAWRATQGRPAPCWRRLPRTAGRSRGRRGEDAVSLGISERTSPRWCQRPGRPFQEGAPFRNPPSGVPFPAHHRRMGWCSIRRPCVTNPRNSCWNSSVTDNQSSPGRAHKLAGYTL